MYGITIVKVAVDAMMDNRSIQVSRKVLGSSLRSEGVMEQNI
jgi:hypothetical protein